MNSITYYKKDECIADYCFLKKTIIVDKVPVKKQGLTNYHIEVFEWYDKTKIVAYLHTTWIRCGLLEKHCESLREASNFIKSYLK